MERGVSDMYRDGFDQAPQADDTFGEEADIDITADLCFVRDPHGAVLQFLSTAPPTLDVFAVGMSRESLRECRAAIDTDRIDWRMKDGSLIVSGSSSELVLTFVPEVPAIGTGSITLTGASLAAFRAALEELAK